MFCPNCGYENVTKSNYCMSCGTNLGIYNFEDEENDEMIDDKHSNEINYFDIITKKSNSTLNESKETKRINKKNKSQSNVFKSFKTKLSDSREKSRERKAVKIQAIYDNINNVKSELKEISEDYNNNLENKTCFRTNLEDEFQIDIVYYNPKNINKSIYDKKITRKGFRSNMEFFDSYLQLLPIKEGVTTNIPYHTIRRIEFHKSYYELSNCNSAELAFIPFRGIEIVIYFHDGNKCTLFIFNEVTLKEYDSCSFAELYNRKYLDQLLELNKNKDKKPVLDLYQYTWNIGYHINLSLKNRIKSLFEAKFIENNVSVAIDDM